MATAYYNEIDPFAAAWLRELIKAGHIAPGEVDERSIADVMPSDLAGFTQCHFFAGIGVWSYALRQAGWPDDRPVWTGSCPCQPFSSAGKGKGFKDERHLWPEFYRLISQCRPTVCLGEQVASKDGLAWLDLVQTGLEAAGYAFGAVDTCAAGIGAPHIRQRLYWVGSDTLGDTALWGCVRGEMGNEAGTQCPALGSRENERCGRHDTANDGACMRVGHSIGSGQQGQGWRSGAQEQRASECGLPSRVAHAEHQQHQGGVSGCVEKLGENSSRPTGELAGCREAIWMDNPQCNGRGTRRDNDRGHDGQQFNADRNACRPGPTNGFWRDADWLLCRDGKWRAVEPGTFPLANGAATRVGRLRGYGNAINAPQAKEFIEAFMELKEHQPCQK